MTCIGLFMPLIGFLILFSTAHVINRTLTGIIGCATIFMSLLCFASLLIIYSTSAMSPHSYNLFSLIHFEGLQADFSLRIDPLAILMTMIITGVGFLIHVYSVGYMDHDADFARFFAFLNFFVFSMLLLVLAGNLLLFFFGWEGVGLASYLLIGFWYQRPEAAEAATKAFVVNRIGDLGLLLGLLLTFQTFGTADFDQIIHSAQRNFAMGAPIITIITLLYFFGACGKSAQLPLHVWLPDAMAGPTPVSALIHAATMVTAGVYLVVRMHPLFLLAPITLQVVGIIGAFTALFASLCALGQTDLKRVLAYSTVSQLGLMFLACGAGAFYSAMFHLTTHAFIKATLFLSAGNVVHMLHGTTEMGKMGGLARIFSKTHWFFLIGVLALSGIPPLAAFFSKDLILENEFLTGFDVLYYVALAASILTGFYLTRAYCLTFTGPQHLDPEEKRVVKEAPSIMILPVALLTFLSIFGGFLGFAYGKTPWLEDFLAEVGVTHFEKELTTGFLFSPEAWMAIGGAVLAVVSSACIYTQYADRLHGPLVLLKKAFFVDEIYHWIFVIPLEAISNFIARFIEMDIFDGSIRGIQKVTRGIAAGLQQMQSGQIRSYVAWMAAGSVLLILYLVF